MIQANVIVCEMKLYKRYTHANHIQGSTIRFAKYDAYHKTDDTRQDDCEGFEYSKTAKLLINGVEVPYINYLKVQDHADLYKNAYIASFSKLKTANEDKGNFVAEYDFNEEKLTQSGNMSFELKAGGIINLMYGEVEYCDDTIGDKPKDPLFYKRTKYAAEQEFRFILFLDENSAIIKEIIKDNSTQGNSTHITLNLEQLKVLSFISPSQLP